MFTFFKNFFFIASKNIFVYSLYLLLCSIIINLTKCFQIFIICWISFASSNKIFLISLSLLLISFWVLLILLFIISLLLFISVNEDDILKLSFIWPPVSIIFFSFLVVVIISFFIWVISSFESCLSIVSSKDFPYFSSIGLTSISNSLNSFSFNKGMFLVKYFILVYSLFSFPSLISLFSSVSSSSENCDIFKSWKFLFLNTLKSTLENKSSIFSVLKECWETKDLILLIFLSSISELSNLWVEFSKLILLIELILLSVKFFSIWNSSFLFPFSFSIWCSVIISVDKGLVIILFSVFWIISWLAFSFPPFIIFFV